MRSSTRSVSSRMVCSSVRSALYAGSTTTIFFPLINLHLSRASSPFNPQCNKHVGGCNSRSNHLYRTHARRHRLDALPFIDCADSDGAGSRTGGLRLLGLVGDRLRPE